MKATQSFDTIQKIYIFSRLIHPYDKILITFNIVFLSYLLRCLYSPADSFVIFLNSFMMTITIYSEIVILNLTTCNQPIVFFL